MESGAFAEVLVATDDARIAHAVRGFGGTAVMTSQACESGTDRIAEVARGRPDVPVFLNVQGDEPLVDAGSLSALAGCFSNPGVRMATLVRPLRPEERTNPHVVKVVLSTVGDALYFSRADLPFARDGEEAGVTRLAHVGLYGYRREALLEWAALPVSPLERTEKLEQLRAVQAGWKIRCLLTSYQGFGIDTPEDLARAQASLP